MTSSVRVIQRPFGTQGCCLELSINQEHIFLINAPEVIHRVANETKLRLAKFRGLLFTHVNADTVQGYPDLIMTIADLGYKK